ncbi:hypothetical protein SUGI_1228070 [Cryptomeria japonica]|uniref:Uncharacterized protein n=1 Tax=Cryptomeria japonica TaxID=3369 RepID=A0AAD3RPH1_CRYJA|nr:hypothetical protein SUGI_1228070 [Cryptomeria japonica]
MEILSLLQFFSLCHEFLLNAGTIELVESQMAHQTSVVLAFKAFLQGGVPLPVFMPLDEAIAMLEQELVNRQATLCRLTEFHGALLDNQQYLVLKMGLLR